VFYDIFKLRSNKEHLDLYMLEKNRSTEHSEGNKTVPEKVATTRTEDGHKQNNKTSTTL